MKRYRFHGAIALLVVARTSIAQLATPAPEAVPAAEPVRHGLVLGLGRNWLATLSAGTVPGSLGADAGPRLPPLRIAAAFAPSRANNAIEREFMMAPVTADWFGHLVPGLQFEFDF